MIQNYFALLAWLAPALVMITISAAYFFLYSGEKNNTVRILVSAHGLLAALLYFSALAMWVITKASHDWAVYPFLLLHLIPIASIIYSLIYFRGPKLLHASQLLNVCCMAYTFFVGAMAVTNDWL